MTVRSKRLLSGSGSAVNAATALYTAQSGETTLIKQLVVLNRNAALARYTIGFGSTSVSTAHFWKVDLPAETAHRYHDIWVVLQPGQSMWLRSDLSNLINISMFGAELEGVAD